jgi:glycosyltransferase involved in cell wall biosynthesis
MRIAIVTSKVPFVHGGAEVHAEQLKQALETHGHDVELIAIPFKWYPPEKILDHLMACRLLDLEDSNGTPIDRVIGLKFPAYHIKHPNKVLWILHQFRTAFDLWGSPEADLAFYPNGRQVRDAIVQVEQSLLPEARAIFTNSRNVANRLQEHCGIPSDPLYHPPEGAETFYSKPAEDYLYYPSRLAPLKRQALVLEALSLCRQPVKVVFSGNPDTPGYAKTLSQLATHYKVDKRVSWLGRVSEADKLELYAKALGIVFPPQDEDYGYITLEAMLAAKPVITCEDSGGPLEFVVDGETGLIAKSEAASLAAAMDRLWKERTFAREAGLAGHKRYKEMDITWKHVVEVLLDEN